VQHWFLSFRFAFCLSPFVTLVLHRSLFLSSVPSVCISVSGISRCLTLGSLFDLRPTQLDFFLNIRGNPIPSASESISRISRRQWRRLLSIPVLNIDSESFRVSAHV
jgi:hypothetical protein